MNCKQEKGQSATLHQPLTPTQSPIVCSTSLMASLIRSVGGLSKYFYQGLWLADPNADVIGKSINRCGVAQDFPHHVTVSSFISARFLYEFPYRFQRAWTILWSMIHPLYVARVGAWNSLNLPSLIPPIQKLPSFSSCRLWINLNILPPYPASLISSQITSLITLSNAFLISRNANLCSLASLTPTSITSPSIKTAS